MITNDFENTLRDQLHRAIDPALPGPAAEERVMRATLDTATSARRMRRFGLPVTGRLGAVLMASLVVLLIGGALGVSLSLRNRATPAGGPPAHRPAPVPTVAVTTSPLITPSPSNVVLACDGAQLTATLADFTGAAGTEGGDILLRNIGPVACTMRGYANLEGVSAGNVTQLGVTHSIGGTLLNNNRGTLPTVQLITLQPGQKAYIAIEYSDVPNGSGQCPTFDTLRITPPDAGRGTVMAPPPAHTLLLCGGHGAAIWIDEAPVSAVPYYGRS